MTSTGASNTANVVKDSAACLYGPHYYDTYGRLGPCTYSRENPMWLQFFGQVADEIARQLRPDRVLDVGCAKGFLVESLRDRGVKAYGFDVSEYAICQVRDDVKPYCWVGSAADSIREHYDLITCIEVCEHIAENEANEAVRQMTTHSDVILFSSTPHDFTEPTHINVHPIIDWLRLFARFSFVPDETFDASFLSPQAILFRRQQSLPPDQMLCRFAYERTRAVAARELRNPPEIRRELDAILNSKAWRLIMFCSTLRFRVKHPIVEALRKLNLKPASRCEGGDRV